MNQAKNDDLTYNYHIGSKEVESPSALLIPNLLYCSLRCITFAFLGI